MVRDLTPLGIVQHDLMQHTSRNPSGVEAVMSTIRDAVATLGHEQASDFSQRLIHSLDPHVHGGLGVAGAEALGKLGNLAANPDAERSERWGATSLLGVLAMTHKPDSDQLTPENFRAQIAGTLARTALTQLIRSETAEPEQVAVAEAFLTRTSVSTEDVATELHLEGFVDTFASRSKEETTFELPTEEAEILMGSHVSEPLDYTLPQLSAPVKKEIAKMSWLNDDIENIARTARKIFKDGKHIATIVDITSGNTFFKKLHKELASDTAKYTQFWNQMAITIAQHLHHNRTQTLHNAKVQPTYYMSNKTRSNAHVVRGYYVGLGKDTDGETPLLGLITAYRSKANQDQVLRLVTNSSQKTSER